MEQTLFLSAFEYTIAIKKMCHGKEVVLEPPIFIQKVKIEKSVTYNFLPIFSAYRFNLFVIQYFLLWQVVCYYTNWAQYRPKHGKFVPEDIQPDLCTHIIFAFGWLKKNKLSSYESNDETKDGKTGLYERMMTLKKANPKLKVLLAIGKFVRFFYCYQQLILTIFVPIEE